MPSQLHKIKINSFLLDLVRRWNELHVFVLVAIILKMFFLSIQISDTVYLQGQVINLVMVAFIYYFLQLVFNKKQIYIAYLLDVIISFIAIANIIFYRAYGDFIPIGALNQIDHLPAVRSSILYLIGKGDFVYLVDLPLIFFYKKIKNTAKIKLKRSNYIIPLLITTVFLSISIIYIKITIPSSILKGFNKVTIHNKTGFLPTLLINNYNHIKDRMLINDFSQESFVNIRDEIKSNLNENGRYKNKNLIIIQVESLQNFVINNRYNSKEITPNINKLIRDSAYFDNCYYQISTGHTSDAELLSNTSLYPLSDSAAFITKSDNTYYSISKSLRNIGYSTFAFHGNYYDFWNRGIMYKTLGFDNFYDLSRLEKDDLYGIALTDKSFFNQTANIIKDTDNPFYSFIVTLSSHSPFMVRNDFCEENNNLEQYINSINYTDKCIGEFLKSLEDQNLLKDSVIILYGDHNGMTLNDKYDLMNYTKNNLDREYLWRRYQRVPMIIRLPDGSKKGTYNKSVGQIDVFPTVANLLGIQDIKYLGRDMFETGNNLVVLRDGSYIFGNLYYNSTQNKTFDVNSGKEKYNDEFLIKKALKQLKASDDIFRYDYFRLEKIRD